MSYHNVVHVGHKSGYPSEYPPPPDFLPPQQPGFLSPHEYYPGPPPPQPPQQQPQRYQDYFYEGYTPPHSAQPYHRHHYENYENGCDSFLRTCLGTLCCCWILERCCCY